MSWLYSNRSLRVRVGRSGVYQKLEVGGGREKWGVGKKGIEGIGWGREKKVGVRKGGII